MFDIGMSELLIIGIVSLIVVGPKDLPGMFRTLGRFTAKIKAMGREFSHAMEAAADDAGVKDIKSSLNAAANPTKFGLDKLKDAATDFENWDPMKANESAAPETAEMDDDRADMARQINEATAAKATARKAAEVAASAAPMAAAAEPAAQKAPVRKAPQKSAVAKKASTAKATKPTAKRAAVKKTAPKKAAPPKASSKKTAPKKAKAAAQKTEDKA